MLISIFKKLTLKSPNFTAYKFCQWAEACSRLSGVSFIHARFYYWTDFSNIDRTSCNKDLWSIKSEIVPINIFYYPFLLSWWLFKSIAVGCGLWIQQVVPKCNVRLLWLLGFCGSSGYWIVLCNFKEKCRWTLQTFMRYWNTDPLSFKNRLIGINYYHHNPNVYESKEKYKSKIKDGDNLCNSAASEVLANDSSCPLPPPARNPPPPSAPQTTLYHSILYLKTHSPLKQI